MGGGGDGDGDDNAFNDDCAFDDSGAGSGTGDVGGTTDGIDGSGGCSGVGEIEDNCTDGNDHAGGCFDGVGDANNLAFDECPAKGALFDQVGKCTNHGDAHDDDVQCAGRDSKESSIAKDVALKNKNGTLSDETLRRSSSLPDLSDHDVDSMRRLSKDDLDLSMFEFCTKL